MNFIYFFFLFLEVSSVFTDKSNLCYWGLPETVSEAYKKEGIDELYPWQIECLEQDRVLQGQNLVYSAPTSSGKSLVAEILMLRKILSTKKKAIVILPFVSVVAEKEKFMKRVYSCLGLLIEGYYANKGGHTLFDHEEDELNIAICTIEKANSLLNRSVEEGKIDDIGIVIIDEIHMMGDSSRGYILELLVTKLLYLQLEHLQIVGLSATLPNINVFSKWLNASIYITDFRPVPLIEYVKVGNKIYDKNLEEVRTLDSPYSVKDPEQIIDICIETLIDNNSVLIFCSSKRNAELLCRKLASIMPNELCEKLSKNLNRSQISNIINQLKRTPGGLDPVLENSVPSFVAYHHSGLTIEEREIIETAFRNGIVKILTATSTLAAGVNLPARRVIFQNPQIGIDFLDATRYNQMAGRAGRKGIDTLGESYLFCKKNQLSSIKSKVLSELLPLESCLIQSRRGMIRPLMDVIASGVVETVKDVERYIMSTLFAKQKHFTEVHQVSKAALRFLEENDFVSWMEDKQKFSPSKLGKATVASALSPEEGLVVFEELKKARAKMILDTELHIVYQVTPIYHNISPDWDLYLNIYSSLNEYSLRVAELVGVNEGFLVRASSSRPRAQHKETAIHTRFFASLILQDLIKEISIQNVSQHYRVPRGHLQSLQTTAATFCGMVTVFCQQLKWWSLHSLIGNFADRLCFGVEPDIIPLAQIPHVKGNRARILFKKGYKTVSSIAAAHPLEIEEILRQDAPYKHCKDEDAIQTKKIEARIARLIVNGAQQLLGDHTVSLEKSVNKLRSIPRVARDNSPKIAKKYANQRIHSPLKNNNDDKKLKELPLVQPIKNTSSKIPVVKELSNKLPLLKPKIISPLTNVNLNSPKQTPTHTPQQNTTLNSPLSSTKPIPKPIPILKSITNTTPKIPLPNTLKTKPIPKQLPKPINSPVITSHIKNSPSNMIKSPPNLVLQSNNNSNTVKHGNNINVLNCSNTSTNSGTNNNSNLLNNTSNNVLNIKNSLITPNINSIKPPVNTSTIKIGTNSVNTKMNIPPPKPLNSPPTKLDLPRKSIASLNAKPNTPPRSLLKSSRLTKTITKVSSPPISTIKSPTKTLNIIKSPSPPTKVSNTFIVNNILSSKMNDKKTFPPPNQNTNQYMSNIPTQQSFTRISPPDIKFPEPDSQSFDIMGGSPQSEPSPPEILQKIGCIHPASTNFPFTIITVHETFQAYEELLILWSQQPHFSFSLLTSIEGSDSYRNNNDEWHSSGILKANLPSLIHKEPEVKKITKKQQKLLEEMPHLTNIDGICICWNEKQCFFLSLRTLPTSSSSHQLESYRWELIRRVMVQSTAHKTAYEMAEKYQLLLECGIRVHKTLQDPRIAAWMIDPEEKASNGSLDALAERFIPSKKINGTSAYPIGKTAKETMQSWMLMSYLLQRLKVDILFNPFRDIEMEVVPILAEMQHWGMGFQKSVCNTHQNIVENTLKILEEEAHRSVGKQFSLTAPIELANILFNELQLPCSKELTSKKTIKANKPPRKSTSAQVLQQITHLHPLPGLILEHRKLTTWRIKYINNLPKYAVYSEWLGIDRIHAVQLHTQTPTGRLAVKNPNLQCIPHTLDFTTHGGSSQNTISVSIRDSFEASSGCLLLSADYSQLEVRLMTHFSQDPLLLSIFRKGGDVFKSLASAWLNKPISEITQEERSHVCYYLIIFFFFVLIF